MYSYVECSIEDLYFKIDWNGKGLERGTAYHETKGMYLREQTEIYLNAVVLNSEVWKEILPKPIISWTLSPKSKNFRTRKTTYNWKA